MAEQIAEILRRIAGRHGCARARVPQTVADLGSIEDSGIDHSVQGRGLADGGDAEETELALDTQPLEGGNDLLEDRVGPDIAAACGADDRVVELKQIDGVASQPLQAR